MSSSIPQTSGIYKITCFPTGKVYVGSAVNLYRRWQEHRTALRRDAHKNVHLQNAWRKYGEDAFVFTVLELILSPFLIEREQYWLDTTKAYDRRRGFNIATVAGSNIGIVRSEETRRRWSEQRRGKSRGPMPESQRRALSEAKRGMKYRPHSEDARRAKRERMKGRIVSDETRKKISAAHKGQVPSITTRQAQFDRVSKVWVITDPDSRTYTIKGLEGFCREQGLTATCMRAVADGKASHHKGWTCRRS